MVNGFITGLTIGVSLKLKLVSAVAYPIVTFMGGVGGAAGSYINQRMNGVAHKDIDKEAIIADALCGAFGNAVSGGVADIGNPNAMTFKSIMKLPGKKILKKAADDFMSSVTVAFGTWIDGMKMKHVM